MVILKDSFAYKSLLALSRMKYLFNFAFKNPQIALLLHKKKVFCLFATSTDGSCVCVISILVKLNTLRTFNSYIKVRFLMAKSV